MVNTTNIRMHRNSSVIFFKRRTVEHIEERHDRLEEIKQESSAWRAPQVALTEFTKLRAT